MTFNNITNLIKNMMNSSQNPVNVQCNPKMYLILREDLAYKYIQGGHALSQFAIEHYDEFKEWNNRYLINLSVFNGVSLQELNNNLCYQFGKNKVSIFVGT